MMKVQTYRRPVTRASTTRRAGMELQMQSARGGGLADALKQYGVLRSHSITQQAGIQIEEKKLHILEKRLNEEKQKVSPPPYRPPRPRPTPPVCAGHAPRRPLALAQGADR